MLKIISLVPSFQFLRGLSNKLTKWHARGGKELVICDLFHICFLCNLWPFGCNKQNNPNSC